ncbi:DUF2442 domain-containing protein [Deinococcus frigens]|uniref:DUF2442 domain-containing protein n=1 Tax=Deinococcus frigens TaxID=249403 RepID=UPI00138E17AB|nr:DUF2442 domain-containing protein [Deinococcus frigens]
MTAEAPHTLHLTFTDGVKITTDLSSLLSIGSIFAPLRQPEFFERVAIGDKGRSLIWPGEIDLDANSFRPEKFLDRKSDYPLYFGINLI